jgi:DNA phosphorothioation-dependent restriction protein DptG
MTKLLTEAFEKTKMLPEEIQNQIAQELLDEINSKEGWDKLLSDSQEVLEKLSEKAVKEYNENKTKIAGFDDL